MRQDWNTLWQSFGVKVYPLALELHEMLWEADSASYFWSRSFKMSGAMSCILGSCRDCKSNCDWKSLELPLSMEACIKVVHLKMRGEGGKPLCVVISKPPHLRCIPPFWCTARPKNESCRHKPQLSLPYLVEYSLPLSHQCIASLPPLPVAQHCL